MSDITSIVSSAAGIKQLPAGLKMQDFLTQNAWLPHKDAKTQRWVPGYLTGDKLKARMSMLCLWDLPGPAEWLLMQAACPLPLPKLDWNEIANTTISSVVMVS
jgi:hypothetical protein